jgi:hypothetical protein
MYTKLDDWCHAHKVNELLRSNPSMTQKELCKLMITNFHRLKYLEQQGLIKLRRRVYEQRTKTSYTQISNMANE